MPYAANLAADDALLRHLLISMGQELVLDRLLALIVRELAAIPTVALARIWLIAPGDICPSCPLAGECPARERCLHLEASAGRPSDGHGDWGRLDGAFRRFPLGVRKIGRIAATNSGLTVADIAAEAQWIARPEWVRAEGIAGFCGKPLAARGEVVGVLGVFTRVPCDAGMSALTEVIANHAAISIANARAFAEIDRLRRASEAENEQLKADLAVGGAFGAIIGASAPIRAVTERIALIAPTPASVLITGESGTGKELVARELHRRSRRAAGPLVRVNCAAIPDALFESEFFGHARGAFTGATGDRQGRFAAADGGTLFLDEVGEIPLAMQGKLLRVLQEGTYERVGEDRTRSTDVRVIAATNRDLGEAVREGRFREDLFYRLNVVPVHLPPLRERRGDIGAIARHLLVRLAQRFERTPPRLTRADLDLLEAQPWPGNVRELSNCLERALITGRGERLALELAARSAPPPQDAPTDGVRSETAMVAAERRNLQAALAQSGGRIFGSGGAAELIGLKPTTLISRLKKHGIARKQGM